jgi:hypothetical protein
MHQPNHIQSRTLATVGIVMALGTVLVMVACWFLWRHAAYAPFRPVPAARVPAVQAHPARELAAMRQEQMDKDSYAWEDRKHGVARIPVRRAMAIMAKERSP